MLVAAAVLRKVKHAAMQAYEVCAALPVGTAVPEQKEPVSQIAAD